MRQDDPQKFTRFDMYDAGAPPGVIFRVSVDNVEDLIASASPFGSDQKTDLCIIGLAAYFEVFCKHLFAAVVNICPTILEAFATRRDCSFAVSEVLHLTDGNQHRIGSVLSEHYDFGSAALINSLFFDLLRISPFSKDDAKKYSEFLNDRNLLVHHGGIYTYKYARHKFAKEDIPDIAHQDSLYVWPSDVQTWESFLINMGKKLAKAAKLALNEFIERESITLDSERRAATDALDHFEREQFP